MTSEKSEKIRPTALNFDLKRREFWLTTLMCAIQFIHVLDFVILMPLGPKLMSGLDLNATQFAGLVSSYAWASALSGPLIGMWALGFQRKNLLYTLFICFLISTLGCALSHSYTPFLWSRVLAGFFGGALNSVVILIISENIPYERRGRSLGIVMSSFSIASVLGVPIGLWISDIYNYEAPFFFIVALGVIVFFGLSLKIPQLQGRPEKISLLQGVKNLYHNLMTLKYLKGHLLIMSVSFSSFMLIPFLTPFAVHNIGIKEELIKYLYFVGGAFTVFSAQAIGRYSDRYRPAYVFTVLTVLSCIPVYLYTHAQEQSFLWYLMIGVPFMILMSGRFIPVVKLTSEIPSDKDRPVFMGLLNALRSFATGMASFVAGLMITTVDHSEKLLHFDRVGKISIGISLFCIIYFLFLQKQQQGFIKHA